MRPVGFLPPDTFLHPLPGSTNLCHIGLPKDRGIGGADSDPR